MSRRSRAHGVRPPGRRRAGGRRAGGRAGLGGTTWTGIALLAGFVLLATVGRALAGSPTALDGAVLEAPSWSHPFGTDNLGRDLFARTATGAWTSLVVSGSSVLAAVAVAVPIGVLAARSSGRGVDTVLMRLVETVQAVPHFVLVVLLLGLTGTAAIEVWGVSVSMTTRLVVCLAIGFVPYFARVARTAALVELEEEYVAGLRLLGVPEREVIAREVVPNIAPALGVQVLLAMAIAVFAEGGLSFIGLGVPAPTPTLGNLIAEAGGQLLDDAWWYALIPGLVLVAGISGFNLVGDAAADRAVGSTGAGRSRPAPSGPTPIRRRASEPPVETGAPPASAAPPWS